MSRRKTPNRLSADDLALWRKVTDRTEKLDLKTLFTPEIDSPPPADLRRAKAALSGTPRAVPKRSGIAVAVTFRYPLK